MKLNIRKDIFKKKNIFAFIFILFLSLIFSTYISNKNTYALDGSQFNPGRIIDDSVFYNGSSMSVAQIQSFLDSKLPSCDTNGIQSHSYYYNPSTGEVNNSDNVLNGDVWVTTTRAIYGARVADRDGGNWRGSRTPYTCFNTYRQSTVNIAPESGICNGYTGVADETTAQMLFKISQSCGINPQVLIVLLQKEQSLITDTWPWGIQYMKATGVSCPDSYPAEWAPYNCDPEYVGFFKQMYYGAHRFKKYKANANNYNYKAGRNNTILWHPNTGCGTSNVYIENQATAALYIYTPYRPNNAALFPNSGPQGLYGVGDSCSSYGNRNFWRMFNDWFGPTTGEGFALMTSAEDNGDTRQWVVYKGIKRHVPSTEILRAWKLDEIVPIQTSGLYLGAIPTAPQPLDRLMRPTGTLDVYFVDNGMAYRISSPDVFSSWGLNPAAIVDVSEELARVPVNKGDLTFAVRTSSDLRVFFMDGGVLRHIQNTETLEALEGFGAQISFISQDYYNSTAQSEPLSSPRVRDSLGTNYIISNRSKLSLSPEVINLFPWSSAQLSTATLQRMGSGIIEPFVRADGDMKVYLIDNQQKHHITDPNVLSAWQPSNRPNSVSVVSRGVVNLINTGSQITDYFSTDGTSHYLIDKNKKIIPSALIPAYTGTRNVYSASQNLLNLFQTNGSTTNFVKVKGQVQSYLLTNSGVLRHITSTEKFNLWAGAQPVTEITNSNASGYILGGGISAFVSDGALEFVMDGGVKSPVSGPIKNNWKLTNPDILNDGTLNNFTTNAPLSNEIQNSNQFYLISDGVSYGTVDTNIANIWLINNAQTKNLNLIKEFLPLQPLTRFVLSKNQNDTRLFAVDKGILYHLTPEHSLNLGSVGPYMYVNPELISKQPITLWGGILIKNDSGAYYVIDGGGKRTFSNSIIFDHWRRLVQSTSIPIVSNGFTDAMQNKGFVERAIKGSSPAVYSADSIKKLWIRSTQTYNSNFGVYSVVSDSLINALPSGPDIQ